VATGEPAGTVIRADKAGLLVATANGLLQIGELQREGGKRLPAADFLRGHPIAPGSRFTP
jgi:methionyl-tRNA formyltransferase